MSFPHGLASPRYASAGARYSILAVVDASSFCSPQPVPLPEEDQGSAQEADPYVRAVCFSPDGLSIVAGMEDNSAKILLLREDGGQQGATTLSGHEVRAVPGGGRCIRARAGGGGVGVLMTA